MLHQKYTHIERICLGNDNLEIALLPLQDLMDGGVQGLGHAHQAVLVKAQRFSIAGGQLAFGFEFLVHGLAHNAVGSISANDD